MIGNHIEAAIIAQWRLDEVDDWEYDAPIGFEYIGEGASRVAFRSVQTNVVYKRHYYPDDKTNETEFDNILRAKSIPLKGWRVPEVSLYQIGNETIIAMEYIEGTEDVYCQRSYSHWNWPCNCGKPTGVCSAETWEQPETKWAVEDIHTGNIVIDESGCRVLIDLGG